MKTKIWRWLRDKVFRIDEGSILPKRVLIVRSIIFPIGTIRYWPTADPRWEPWDDVFYIFGNRYSGAMFRDFARNGMLEGTLFRFMNCKDGIVTLKKIPERGREDE